MTILIGIILSLIFIAISLLHFYWAIGGRWNFLSVVPTKETGERIMNPGTFSSIVVSIGLFLFAILILIKTNLISINIPMWLFNYGCWILALIFIARAIGDFKYVGFFKKIKDTDFGKADTKYFSPLCLFIGVLCIVLEWVR